MQKNSNKNEYALVTGAASGMGRIYAHRLSQLGYRMILADINASGLESLERELDAAGASGTLLYPCDLCTKGIASQIAAFADAHGAKVKVLVNNAGMLVTSRICDTAPARLEAITTLHCITPLLLCREFIPRMHGHGYVLNISSICAWMEWPMIGMYANTKRFIKGFSRSLRIENAGSGVSVTTAFFGAVDTPLFGFPPKLRRLMLASGAMLTPVEAVDRALGAMITRRRRTIPGIINCMMIPLLPMLPDSLLALLVRKFGYIFERKV